MHTTQTAELEEKTKELADGLATLVPKLKEKLDQEAKEKAKAEAEAAAIAALNLPQVSSGEVCI